MGSPNDVGAEPGTGPVTGSFSQDPSSTISTTTTTTTTSYLSTSASALNGKSGSNTHEANLESGLPQSEQYCLRWMNHGSHMLGVFSQLLHDEALVDVTLAAEGQSVRAHKMVLSACSSFFRNLFISHPERHPIIILKDTKFEELKTLLEFMYKGEVSVEHGQLGTLLKTAENLRVKGLAEIATDQSGHPVSTPPPPTADDSEEENSTIVVERDPSETNSGPDKRGTLPCLQQDNLSYYPPPYVHPHHQPYHVYDHPKVHHGSLQYANYGGYPFEYRDVNRHGRDDFMCSNGRLSNTSKPPLRFACLDLNNKGKEENQSDKNISQVHRRDTEESTERNTPLSNTTNVSAARAELKDPHRSSSPNPRSPAAETRDLAMSTNTSQYPWPAEESDISESDEEPSDVNRNTTDLEGHARQNTIFQQGGVSSVRSKQCQSLPLSLKKEPEWDAGPGASAGAGPSGMDTQPSRSPSVSDSSSEYGHHVDQFSDGQMPTAEVVIEEGDFLSPTPSLAAELSSECVSIKDGGDQLRRKRLRDSADNSLEIFPSSDVAGDGAASPFRPRKRVVAFRTTDGHGIDIECRAEDLSTSPGSVRKDMADEVTISAIERSAGQPCTPALSSDGTFPSSCYLPIMAPQFDFSTKFASLPLNFSTNRSGSCTPRPGPSSAMSAEDSEDVGCDSRADLTVRNSMAGLSLSSISLIESHVGVGFTLGSREKPYKCEQCGQCYKYLSAFTKHKEQNHTARLPGEKPFRCEVCGMQFKYLKSFKKHRLNHAVERLHPVYPRPLGSLVEERSVLEMIARPLNEKRAEESSEEASPEVRAASAGNEEGDGLPVVHIKTEVDAASSNGDSNEVGKGSRDTPTEEGSQQQSCGNDVAQQQSQLCSAALQRQIATCPHCHMKFVNEESLKLHSMKCTESHLTAGPSIGVTSLPGPVDRFGGTISPSLLHEALRHQQQRAAFLAALSHNSLVASAQKRSEQENAPASVNDDPVEVSDKDGSEVDNDSQGALKSPAPAQPKIPFPIPGAGTFRPPPLHSTPPAFMHGVFRDLSAVNPMAAAAAVASAALTAAPITPVPPQDYDPGRPHLCPFCGKGFRAKENLKLHIRKHTGERPFECEFCGRAFGGKSDMNRHLRIHTGERPYRCDACGKTFARADYLSKHLSTHLV